MLGRTILQKDTVCQLGGAAGWLDEKKLDLHSDMVYNVGRI